VAQQLGRGFDSDWSTIKLPRSTQPARAVDLGLSKDLCSNCFVLKLMKFNDLHAL